MVKSIGYILGQCHAVINIASNTPNWRDRLDTSDDGIFGSFIALPISILFTLVEFSCVRILILQSADAIAAEQAAALAMGGIDLLLNALAMGINWLLTLFGIAHLAKRFSKAHNFGYFLPAFNWASLLLHSGRASAIIILFGLSHSGVITQTALPLTFVILLCAFCASLYLFWGVFSNALNLSIQQTFSAFALIVLIGIFIQLLLRWIATLFVP